VPSPDCLTFEPSVVQLFAVVSFNVARNRYVTSGWLLVLRIGKIRLCFLWQKMGAGGTTHKAMLSPSTWNSVILAVLKSMVTPPHGALPSLSSSNFPPAGG
jgi:hypothetical protein